MKKYYYRDNWSGRVCEFDTLREAKKAARLETGVSITIYDKKGIVCFTPASGVCPS